jgi:hypothetical protein
LQPNLHTGLAESGLIGSAYVQAPLALTCGNSWLMASPIRRSA